MIKVDVSVDGTEEVPVIQRNLILLRKKKQYCFILSGMFIVLSITLVLVFLKESTSIFSLLSKTEPSFIGFLISSCTIILGVQPFVPGYGYYVVAVGFIFHWYAFPIVYVSSIIGGMCTFQWTKYMYRNNMLSIEVLVLLMPSLKLLILIIGDIITNDSYFNLALLQLTYAPYGGSILIATLYNCEWKRLLVAMLISRFKLIPYVMFGILLQDLLALTSISIETGFGRNIIITVVSMFCSGVAVLYFSYRARKIYQKYMKQNTNQNKRRVLVRISSKKVGTNSPHKNQLAVLPTGSVQTGSSNLGQVE